MSQLHKPNCAHYGLTFWETAGVACTCSPPRMNGENPSTPPGRERNLGNGEPWWATAITGTDLDAAVFPPLSFLVERVLTEGSVTLLAGAPKAGKSYVAFSLACAVACGGKALDQLPATGPVDVLLVSLDDQSRSRAQRRLREVMQGEPIPAGLTLHTEPNLGVSELYQMFNMGAPALHCRRLLLPACR